MDTYDYLSAVDAAAAEHVELPIDEADPGETPWCADLGDAFRSVRRVVHEERLIDSLLDFA